MWASYIASQGQLIPEGFSKRPQNIRTELLLAVVKNFSRNHVVEFTVLWVVTAFSQYMQATMDQNGCANELTVNSSRISRSKSSAMDGIGKAETKVLTERTARTANAVENFIVGASDE